MFFAVCVFLKKFLFCFLIRLISLSFLYITITFLLFLVQNKEQNYDLSVSLTRYQSTPQQNKKIYVNLKRTLPEVRRPVLRPVEPATPGTLQELSLSLSHSLPSILTHFRY